ncbi:P-loop containing nucleoside triphosphate hydrolase [Plasmopara halstedii]|uniref:p-loop containing nucleoside triphosphate hydrolase n=1 Tax=Plasmopara halstedii TaxID=4781 RepID=A0A0P1AGD9_PLAHL|nr:P-loop containing nucleoside triphosphate hydrolase [Plasmopara halstedii]CEG39815.1 P-loop containing nucleoside triphosphate hydrolase [Plasmopara halstedii]|eukprot:XP_024576184.1 P-loop containing nucleoside triphosphate hydrolase [Plasmopara halstedii]
MARQVLLVQRLPWRFVILRKTSHSSKYTHRLLCKSYSSASSDSDVPFPVTRPNTVHKSLVTNLPNRQALQHVRWLLQQPNCRILLLTGSPAFDSFVRAELEKELSVFELERHGHGIFGVREFCQLLLRESDRDRRVFNRAQLTALMLHNGISVPGAPHLTAMSTLQRRKGVQNLLQHFHLLEKEGVTAEKYASVAAKSDNLVPQKLVEVYQRYQELLVQHNVISWDGVVLEVAGMCGLHDLSTSKQEAITAKEFSQMVMKEYTDVVIENVERITPTMAKLLGHLCGQPSVQSSASYSRVLGVENECARTQQLEEQLLKTAIWTGIERSVTRVSMQSDIKEAERREQMQVFAQQILTQNVNPLRGALCPIPFQCWKFETTEAEEKAIGAFFTRELQRNDSIRVTVLCPSYADVHRIVLAFKKQKIPVAVADDHVAARVNSTGKPIHLFDEPGINAVYSLLCALCFPSDSRHLYNILRSDYIAFPPELLSWLMEKDHRSHVDLFTVLEGFVNSQGTSLGTSYTRKDADEVERSQLNAIRLETGLKKAESFVNLIKRLRAKCHEMSAVELVQIFLEESGRLTSLVNPSSPAEEREALLLADFLRELETVQNIVKSDKVTFVTPYLQQLRETSLTPSASWEDKMSADFSTNNESVRVLPLAKHTLTSIAATEAKSSSNQHTLVLMSMRDSKFPGRMKRLTLPLPYELLSEPYPVQTRLEHLKQCEGLAYEALMLAEYNAVVLSFAELASSSSKREVLSRTLQPIWHDGDEPEGFTMNEDGEERKLNEITSFEDLEKSQHLAFDKFFSKEKMIDTSYSWFSKAARFMRELANRMLHPHAAINTYRSLSKNDDTAARARQEQDKEPLLREKISDRAETPHLRALPLTSPSYEPSHLSYSQISEYLRCPHRYYLSRVMKLNGDMSTSMMFGSALHTGIAAFAKVIAAAQQRGMVTEEAKMLAAIEAKAAFRSSWVGDGYGLFTSSEQASVLFERGMMALYDFAQSHHDDLQHQEIVGVEQEFSIFVPEANIELRGVWDRIDRVSNNDRGSSSLVIKEFKSNMSGAQRNMQKLVVDSLQLKLYMYAFRKVYGEAPYGAQLQEIGENFVEERDDLSNKRQTSYSRKKNKIGFELFSEKAEREAVNAIVEVASRLREGHFDPKPTFAECAFCPYVASACHSVSNNVTFEN